MSCSKEQDDDSEIFPIMKLPDLVLERVLEFITDPFDIKASRLTCKTFKRLIDQNPEALLKLQLIVKSIPDFSLMVEEGNKIHWNNIQFPPELNRAGSRRPYVERFTRLLESFADQCCGIRVLDLNTLNLRNKQYLHLLTSCNRLEILKVDNVYVNGLKKEDLQEILDDVKMTAVFARLKHLDVTAFEFITEEFQFTFMGNILQKCKNLESLGSWGYFPEWESPTGGVCHFKYFLWPLLTYLRARFEIVDLMLGDIDNPEDFSKLNLQYLSEAMDWQSSKWIIDLRPDFPANNSSLERYIYSRITSYIHKAVGWFDSADYKKAGLDLMTNLQTILIHNARDIKLSGENPYGGGNLFPKLENLNLIVGNRIPETDENSVLLEKVIVEMLLNANRPTVQTLNLDMDLDHHHQFGIIDLSTIITNFPNITSFTVEEWGPTNAHLMTIYDSFPLLHTLAFCGRNVTDYGLLGTLDEDALSSEVAGIRKLEKLHTLKILSVRVPPKNVFPWPTRENSSITDFSFQWGFSQMHLRKFHFLLKSRLVTKTGIDYLRNGMFSRSVAEFVVNRLPEGVDSIESFHGLHKSFKFMDPHTFLGPSSYVIPDIGRWML